MMGEVAAQGSLLSGDYLHLEYVGRTTFYGWLATEGPRVYPDGAFRDFYVLDNGRKSAPPSQMMWMVLLQWYDKVSDAEAVDRTKYDLRWKTSLGIEDHEGLCAKFTLQTFRAKLVLNERGRAILERSVKARSVPKKNGASHPLKTTSRRAPVGTPSEWALAQLGV